MNLESLELKRDMFALDIANLQGICKNYLDTYKDIVMVHSDKKVALDGKEHVFLRAERPNNTGFDFVEVILPENKFYMAFGFSDDELLWIEDYLEKNVDKIMQQN